jgi:Family of unknown function (DUF6502)
MDQGPPPAERLLKASMYLLRPLVRLLLRAGVTFPVFSDWLRVLFVDTAVAELEADGQARTDSRLSLLTGVHRKEIRRLREIEREPVREPAVVTLASEIIARWLVIQPRATELSLPRSADHGPSFEALVRSVTNDIRPRAVLDEWLRQGIVRMDGNDRVTLTATAYVPNPGSEAQLFYFGRNLHDHLAAAAANVLAKGAAPYPDISVHYDGLGLEAARALEATARLAAETVTRDINAAAVRLVDGQDQAPTPPSGTRRVNFGVYLYVEDEPPSGKAP